MKTFLKKILLLSIIIINNSAIYSFDNKNIVIYPTENQIFIDGIANEPAWNSISFIQLAESKGDIINKNNTARFKMTYDSKFIYVYAEIDDEVIDTSQNKNIWEKDCFEVYFSMDTTFRKMTSSGTDGVYMLRKVFGREMRDYISKGYSAKEQVTSKGFSQEWCLPWDSLKSTLKDKTAAGNKTFKFECSNGDNDGFGRNNQLFWNSNYEDCYSPNPKSWGFVHLAYSLKVDNFSENQFVTFRSGIIQFYNFSKYSIYSINGSVIKSGNGQFVRTDDLSKGVYIISVNGLNYKFVK